MTGLAAAGGSDYVLSYTTSANSNIIPAVDLVAVSSSYAGGANLTASLTVAGTPIVDNPQYSYFWLFGGGATSNSTAWAFVSNQTAYLHSPQITGLIPVEQISYTVSGSTLSISVGTSIVGPVAGYSLNGEASRGDSADPSTYSFLGTNYGAGPVGHPGSPNSETSSTPFPIGAVIWPIVIAVIVIIVVLWTRRRKAPASPPNVPPSPPPPPPPPVG